MYRGFNLDLDWENIEWCTSQYYDLGESLYNDHKARVKKGIERFISDDGSIDGAKMESDWFPLIQADIFISHSHADKEKAICLAGYLRKCFGLKSFVDSCIWGNADVLLKSIDNAKCIIPESGNYDYNKRNSSTSHVHMMLSAALLKMIDKTECLFFLKTANSITATTKKIISETESPWLYGEILISSLIRKRTLAQHRPELMKARTYSENAALNERELTMKHKVYTGHLTDLDNSDLEIWEAEHVLSLHGEYPLDGLYERA